MRAAVVAAVLAGCAAHLPPVPLPELAPTTAARGRVEFAGGDLTRLWTVLGRAGIRVEMRGVDETISTSKCDGDADGCARCDLASGADLEAHGAVDALVAALSRYPTSFLDASGVQTIALCRSIHYDRPNKALPAGLADLAVGRLMVTIESAEEDTVHHEVFHMFDWQINATDYSDDVEWQGLNPHGFVYGTRRDSAIQPGFVNSYATTNVHEDRASVWQYVMARPAELCALAEADPIVAAKVRLIWSRVAARTDVGFLRTRATCAAWVDEVRGLRHPTEAHAPGLHMRFGGTLTPGERHEMTKARELLDFANGD